MTNIFVPPHLQNVSPDYKQVITLANACYEVGNYTQALIKYDEALRFKEVPMTAAILGKGKCFYALKDYRTAIEYFKAILSSEDLEVLLKEKLAAHYYRGKCYAELSLKEKGKYLDSAFEDFTEVIEISFREPSVAFNLMLGNQWFDQSGVNSFGRVGGGCEDDFIVPLAYVHRACVYITFKNWDECIKDCINALDLDNNLAAAHLLKGKKNILKN